MLATGQKPYRNQSVEWGRLLAASFVVFLHVPLPGAAGGYIGCLTRMAVPFFFLVSGYFCWGGDAGRLSRRLVHMGKLNLSATLLYLLWGLGKYRYYGGGVKDYFSMVFPNGKPLWDFLLLQVNPFGGHLWYLSALMLCQGIFLVYVRCFRGKRVDYRVLYGLGAVLLGVFFWLSTILPGSVHYFYYRNGWLMGLPLFVLGMFLRQCGGKLPLGDGTLLAIAGTGLVLSFLQFRRFGMTELPVGTLLAVTAVVLLLMRHPKLPSRFWGTLAGKLGTVSTAVYVVHLIFLEVYEMFFQEALAGRLGSGEAWLRPFVVLGLSLLVGILWERGAALWKRRKEKSAV